MAGLGSQHHVELNRVGVQACRYKELRERYVGDSVALQQIDAYDPSTEYHVKFHAYHDALKSGDLVMQAELRAWFDENYPDMSQKRRLKVSNKKETARTLRFFRAGFIGGAVLFLGEAVWLTPPVEKYQAVVVFFILVWLYILNYLGRYAE